MSSIFVHPQSRMDGVDEMDEAGRWSGSVRLSLQPIPNAVLPWETPKTSWVKAFLTIVPRDEECF
jgi:hypothetical protein